MKSLAGIKTKKRNTVTKEQGLVAVQENYTQRNIAFRVMLEGQKAISTLDFDKAKRDASQYMELGYLQGMEYLHNHKGELISRTYDNLDDVLKQIPKENLLKSESAITEFKKLIEIGTVRFSPETNGEHDYGFYQKRNRNTAELEQKSKDYSRHEEERIAAARREESNHPEIDAFSGLLNESEILDLTKIVNAFRRECNTKINAAKPDFIAGLFYDVLTDVLNQMGGEVELSNSSSQNKIENFKACLKERINQKTTETLSLDRELFKDLES